MEVASVGTFLSVGIKLPYFAWFGRPDPGMALQPIPRNMYAAMAIAGCLCFFIGVQPGFLYRLLPFPVEYVPYTAWHVLQTLLLLVFTGLGFFLLRLQARRPRPSSTSTSTGSTGWPDGSSLASPGGPSQELDTGGANSTAAPACGG